MSGASKAIKLFKGQCKTRILSLIPALRVKSGTGVLGEPGTTAGAKPLGATW